MLLSICLSKCLFCSPARWAQAHTTSKRIRSALCNILSLGHRLCLPKPRWKRERSSCARQVQQRLTHALQRLVAPTPTIRFCRSRTLTNSWPNCTIRRSVSLHRLHETSHQYTLASANVSFAAQRFCVDPSYVESICNNSKCCIRAIVIDNLINTAALVGVDNDALFLGVFLFDRYIDIMNHSIFFQQECLDMMVEIGCTCLWIAAKFEQVRVPRMADFGLGDLREMEQQILSAIDYHLMVPTIKTFHRTYLVEESVPPLLYHLSGYLIELALIDVSMLSYAPSMVAASAFVISAYLLYLEIDIMHMTGYKPGDLQECMARLMGVHYAACTTQGVCFVSWKYLDVRRGSVAMIPPVNIL